MAPRSNGKMELELKCPICQRWFRQPILLPCGHSVCASCAPELVCSAEKAAAAERDFDQLSIISETDSGVGSLPPDSYTSLGSVSNLLMLPNSGMGLVCPVLCCKRPSFLSERGVDGLPRNRALERVVERFSQQEFISSSSALYCQLCEDRQSLAVRFCEQCDVAYCSACLEACHPSRGALAKHQLLQPRPLPTSSSAAQNHERVGSSSSLDQSCLVHSDELLEHFCLTCKVLVCAQCQRDCHVNHQCQPVGSTCKTQKTHLSHILQALSEKAKVGTEQIQQLKSMSDRINANYHKSEEDFAQQFDKLLSALTDKRKQLLLRLQAEHDHKNRQVKQQVAHWSSALTRATAILHFCIEMLKESDPVAFLTVSQTLVNRACLAEHHFGNSMEMRTRVNPEFEMRLHVESVMRALDSLTFVEFKGSGGSEAAVSIIQLAASDHNLSNVPGAPFILPEECQVVHNKVTVVWRPCPGPPADSYTLEIDDGAQGSYTRVYHGSETLCVVEGLHFKAVYQARVQAHNSAGQSVYSEYIKLQTTPLAWFNMEESDTGCTGLIFSNENNTVSCHVLEERVALCSTGFSRGVHYWQYTVDRLDERSEPAFGVALKCVSRDGRLGKDSFGWSMYLDSKRSWFLHANEHSERCDGGIRKGSVVGIQLDCDKETLSYYIDNEPHGPIAFNQLKHMASAALMTSAKEGYLNNQSSLVFYPAVSLNCHVQLTLHTGLEAPSDSEESSEDETK